MKARVSLYLHDNDPGYEAHLAPGHWNGFAMPYFTREVADKIAADTDALIAEAGDPHGLARVVWDEDKQAYRDDDPNYEDEESWWTTFVVDGVTLHGIGAGSWTWQIMDEADLEAHAAEYKTLLDQTRADLPATFADTGLAVIVENSCLSPSIEGVPAALVLRSDDDGPEFDTLERALWRADRLIALGSDNGEPDETRLSDVLADLQHWADEHGLSFYYAADRAEMSRTAELKEWGVPPLEDDDRQYAVLGNEQGTMKVTGIFGTGLTRQEAEDLSDATPGTKVVAEKWFVVEGDDHEQRLVQAPTEAAALDAVIADFTEQYGDYDPDLLTVLGNFPTQDAAVDRYPEAPSA